MSRSQWNSRPRIWLAVLTFAFALSLSLSLSLSSVAAPPPATGQAIPPDDAPQNQGQPPPAPAEPDDEDMADLFQTAETPNGIDSSQRESEIYGARIDGLQAEVDDLKERIFRSKARLSVLKETVLHGVLAGSRVIIVHRNLLGSQFRLTKIVVILDGAQIYAKTDDSGALDQEDELPVLDGNIVPGPHTITVELEVKGQGVGIFSYLNSYTFDPRSSWNFTAPENGALRVVSSSFERGNISTEMRDRPSIDWQAIPLDASGKPVPQAERKTAKSKSKSKQKPAAKKPGEPAPASAPLSTNASSTNASSTNASSTNASATKPSPTSGPPTKPAQKPTPQKPKTQTPGN